MNNKIKIIIVILLAIGAFIAVTTVFSNIKTKTINNLVTSDNKVASITKTELLSIKEGTTYADIFKKLGKTKDVGSGLHVAEYSINGGSVYISFVNYGDKNKLSGLELYNKIEYIEKYDIKGTVMSVTKGTDGITMLVEGVIETDTIYDKASVRVDNDVVVTKEDATENLYASFIKVGQKVGVVFTGAVAESYPVQANAKVVRILK